MKTILLIIAIAGILFLGGKTRDYIYKKGYLQGRVDYYHEMNPVKDRNNTGVGGYANRIFTYEQVLGKMVTLKGGFKGKIIRASEKDGVQFEVIHRNGAGYAHIDLSDIISIDKQ